MTKFKIGDIVVCDKLNIQKEFNLEYFDQTWPRLLNRKFVVSNSPSTASEHYTDVKELQPHHDFISYGSIYTRWLKKDNSYIIKQKLGIK